MEQQTQPATKAETPTRPKKFLADFGPGLVLAATGVGAGDIISSTITGAEYGLTLLWALAAGVLLKFVITEGLARWQLATGTTLMEGWRTHLPPFVLMAFFAYFLIWTYVVSSALVAASAMVPAALFPQISQPVWGLLHVLVALAMVYWGTYERFVGIMKFFVALMVFCLAGTDILILRSGARWTVGEPGEFSLAYVLSLIGGVGGTVTLLSYGYWIREQNWSGANRIRTVRNDLGLSYSLVFVFALCVIFLSTQIDWKGEILEEGPQLSLLLGDRIAQESGEIGRVIFLLGFWGAACSSVLGVWQGVPFLFDDWIHLWRRRQPKGPTGIAYRGYAAYMTLASISTLFLQKPVWLIFVYTVTGALFFPFIIATLLWMNNRKAWLPAPLRNSLAVNVLLALGLSLFVYLGLRRFF